MFTNIPANIYQGVFEWAMFFFCLLFSLYYLSSSDNSKLLKQGSAVPTFMICIVMILFVGLRPVSSYFGDTVNYAHSYNLLVPEFKDIEWRKEWLFDLYSIWCKKSGLTVNQYFLGIEIGYIGFMFWACRKLLWEGTWLAMLFCVSALMFFTFGVNGLRNGIACSMILTAIAYVAQDKSYAPAALLAFLAMGIHRSTALPIVACLAAVTVVRDSRMAIYFWVFSIAFSFLFGGVAEGFFAGLGFDERLPEYLGSADNSEGTYTTRGFRWDFLLYSSMPVLLTWYVNKRIDETGGYRDDGSTALADAQSMRSWHVLATTYMLSNAFWVMVIRASFSNRFAYLSWFLYPLVLAYGLLRLHIWDDQDRRCAIVLLAHASFTMLMFSIGKI